MNNNTNNNKITEFIFDNAEVHNFVEKEIKDIIITSVNIYNNDGKFKAVIKSMDLDGNEMAEIRTDITSDYAKEVTLRAIANQLGLYGKVNAVKDFNGKQIKTQMITKSVTDPLTNEIKIFNNFIFNPSKFVI